MSTGDRICVCVTPCQATTKLRKTERISAEYSVNAPTKLQEATYSRIPCIAPITLSTLFRHVVLPKSMVRMLPTGADSKPRIMTDKEWRGIGVQQSRGWEHYAVHRSVSTKFQTIVFKSKCVSPAQLFCNAIKMLHDSITQTDVLRVAYVCTDLSLISFSSEENSAPIRLLDYVCLSWQKRLRRSIWRNLRAPHWRNRPQKKMRKHGKCRTALYVQMPATNSEAI